MEALNANPAVRGGAGGGAGELDNASVPPPATNSNVRRARLLAIAAMILIRYGPSVREWRIIRRSAAGPRVTASVLDQLLIEAAAPSPECADPSWFWGLTRESDLELIVAGRLRGFVPLELLRDAARVAAAVVFGATVTISRRPHDSEREHNALVAVMMKGAADAA